MRWRQRSTILMLVTLLLFGCTFTPKINNWAKLTPKGRLTVAMHIYNQEYDSYVAEVKKPNLTEKEKEILRLKKEALTKLYGVIGTYKSYVLTGDVPPTWLEQNLLDAMQTILDLSR